MSDYENSLQRLSSLLSGSTRQNGARLVHEWLLMERKEQDLMDISAASVLKDLYDCRTCVNHVAQVYLKGIMRAGETVFGMREIISEEEALLIAERTLRPERRVLPAIQKRTAAEPVFLSLERAMELHADCLVDVRPQITEERTGQWTAVSLEEYCRNPFTLTQDIHAVLVFICENGTRSRLAAECAVNVGFRNVYYTRLQQ